MNNYDNELINEEFEKYSLHMSNTVITKTLLDSLFSRYNSVAYTELFYDSEPHITFEEWKELDSTQEGRTKYKKMIEEYDSDRKLFNNWNEPIDRGIWGFTNNSVRNLARQQLNKLKRSTYKDKRFFMGKDKDNVKLYYYGRDTEVQADYWFTFYNDDEISEDCLKCKKYSCWSNCNKILNK